MDYVLLHADTDTALNGAMVLSKMFEKKGIGSCIIFYDDLNYDKLKELNNPCSETKYIRLARHKEPQIVVKVGKVQKLILPTIFLLVYYIFSFRKMYREIYKIMREIKPICFIPYTDRRGDYEAAGIRAARCMGIKVFLPPYSKIYYEQALKNKNNFTRFDKTNKIPLVYTIAKKINSGWTVNYNDEVVFWDIPARLFARRITKMDNPNPWMPGATKPDLIAVYSCEAYNDTIKVLGEDGCKGRLIKTYRVEDEAVINSYLNRDLVRKKLVKKYNLRRDEIIIVSGMALAEAGWTTVDISQKLHKQVFEWLLTKYSQVFFSLHPKMNRGNYSYDSFKDRVIILDEPLRDVVGCADLLITSQESSVNDWSKMTGIPTLVVPNILWSDDRNENVYEYLDNEKSVVTSHEDRIIGFPYDSFVDVLLKKCNRTS